MSVHPGGLYDPGAILLKSCSLSMKHARSVLSKRRFCLSDKLRHLDEGEDATSLMRGAVAPQVTFHNNPGT